MQGNVVELATQGDWLLGAEKVDGRINERRLFLITDLVSEKLPGLAVAVNQINRSGVMGRGYSFQAFDDPCLGCEIDVKPGWELSSAVMKKDFLMRFINTLELELAGDSNTTR